MTAAELAVLRVLWSMGLATIREIRDELYPRGDTSEYATVQKLLERLEAKALVRRSRRSIPHTFSPRVDRDDLLGQRLRDLADDLCQGSIAPIVNHLVQRGRLTANEREELRQLIEGATARRKKGRSRT